MNPKQHWDAIYTRSLPNEVSWFQTEARLSLALIQGAAPDRATRIVDVGGGASTLIDGLVATGYRQVTVLDLSPAALRHAQRRLGVSSALVTWIEGDVLTARLPRHGCDLWHDRAFFHFVTDPKDRALYVAQVRRAVPIGGHVLVATFAEDGPMRCSGLTTARYAPDALHAEFGAGFRLLESRREEHVTPSGMSQAFVYCLCRVEHEAASHPA